MSLGEGLAQSVEEGTPHDVVWEQMVNLSANAARIHREAKDRQRGVRTVIQVADATRKGLFVTGHLGESRSKNERLDLEFPEIARGELPPGTRLKLVTERRVEEDNEDDDDDYERATESLSSWSDRMIHGGQGTGTGRYRLDDRGMIREIREPRSNPYITGRYDEEEPEPPKFLTLSAPVEVMSIGEDPGSEYAKSQARLRFIGDEAVRLYMEQGDRTKLVRAPEKSHERFLDILRQAGLGENVPTPLKSFLSGDFGPLPPEDELAKNDDLDPVQERAYGLAMAGVPNLEIQGPPGTGKTRVVCNIIEGHLKAGRKVLVLSETNPAIDVVGEMLIERKKMKKKHIHRTGNDFKPVRECVRGCRIRKKINFPHAAIRRIDNLTDERVIKEAEKILGQEVYGERAISDARDALKELEKTRYDRKVLEAKMKYQKSLEEDGGVTLSTFGTAISDGILNSTQYDVVIVDESTKAYAEQMIQAGLLATSQLIHIGDPLQLGNIPLEREERTLLEQACYEELIKGEDFMDYAHGTILEDSAEGLTEGQDISERMAAVQQQTRLNIDHIYSEPIPEWAQVERDEDDEGEPEIQERLVKEMKQAKGLNDEDARNEVQKLLSTAVAMVNMYEHGLFSEAVLSCDDPENQLPYVFLEKNRRSLPAITRFLSELIYDGRMKEGREADEVLGDGVVQWIDTEALQPHESTVGTSKRNHVEADVIVSRVLDMVLNPDRDQRVAPEKIAVIATYAQQARLIRRRFKQHLGGNKKLLARLEARVATVDAYQGSESDIVFVSMTRSNDEGEIGFLDERRRFGVAIGRAREQLYLVGDAKTIVEGNRDPESKAFFQKAFKLVEREGRVVEEEVKTGERKKRSHGDRKGQRRRKRQREGDERAARKAS